MTERRVRYLTGSPHTWRKTIDAFNAPPPKRKPLVKAEPKPKLTTATSELEDKLDFDLRLLGICDQARQFKLPGSRRRWDFGWEDARLLVEVQGGTFSRGAHGRGAGIHRDYEKNNIAVKAGYWVLYYDSPMVRDGSAAVDILDVLTKLRGYTNAQ